MPDYERSLQDIKADILARTDIVDVIGNYTRLTKAGKSWKGLCPFHADKNPSFSVTPELNHYRCWSCGEKGDVLTFVMKKENLEFIDALEWLARRNGMPFERPGFNRERASEREQMLELNTLAVKFFQDRLTKSQDGQQYLAGRGILKSTQEQWDIGFAPPGYENLTYFLQRSRVNMQLAAKLGLVKVREENGGYYDAFRNRVIFPIHDQNGRVVAFGGRALSKDEQAKYLNSPASDLFDKSRTLYGLVFAKKKLSGDVPPVFVEGYVDVVTTHQAGFQQCVATLGTSMTEEHARILVRYNPKVIVCYDSDSAGIKATLRGAAVWESLGVEGAEVRVARLPEGDDPDSILRRGETAKFQNALDTAVPRVEFEIELAIKRNDTTTPHGKMAALSEIVPILGSMENRTRREYYALQYAYLHPLQAQFNIQRAVDQMLADAESYRRQSRSPANGRNAGYPQTQKQNGQPLSEEPPPPAYRPPDANSWGTGYWPNTQNVVRKGENRPDSTGANPSNAPSPQNAPPPSPDPAAGFDPSSYGQSGYGQNGSPSGRGPNPNGYGQGYGNGNYQQGGYGQNGGYNRNGGGYNNGYNGKNGGSGGYGRYGKRDRNSPVGDPTPPPLEAPILTGVQKAERQILRACLSSEWRLHILTRLSPDLIVSPECRELFGWIQRTPATPEGGIDARALMMRIEEAESRASPPGSDPITSPENGFIAYAGENSAKISGFLYDLLQESPFLVSNEALNEAAITDCIRRLQKHREQQQLRAEAERLQSLEALSPEQRRLAIEHYHQKVRETRGSPRDEAA